MNLAFPLPSPSDWIRPTCCRGAAVALSSLEQGWKASTWANCPCRWQRYPLGAPETQQKERRVVVVTLLERVQCSWKGHSSTSRNKHEPHNSPWPTWFQWLKLIIHPLCGSVPCPVLLSTDKQCTLACNNYSWWFTSLSPPSRMSSSEHLVPINS